jgi:hypothetical protein
LVGSLPVVLFVYLCVDVRQLFAVDVVLTCVVVFLSFFLSSSYLSAAHPGDGFAVCQSGDRAEL